MCIRDSFTTRADTMFGVTFMVLAPESELVPQLTTEAQKAEVEALSLIHILHLLQSRIM